MTAANFNSFTFLFSNSPFPFPPKQKKAFNHELQGSILEAIGSIKAGQVVTRRCR
tara:strand:- start:452 stop:616 length:165 start_codon:yes stop_codon:yes gene_type:complete